MPAQLRLNASALPPFEPTKDIVQLVNPGPMPALMWAFSSCIPPSARMIFAGAGGASNASLRMHTTPAMQWNYSMFHMAHHYEASRCRKFMLTDEAHTVAILIEVTALRACPEDVEGVLPRSDFVEPMEEGKPSLGALPIFFVRFFYEKNGIVPSRMPSKAAVKFIHEANKDGRGVMETVAASAEEVNFAHNELKRGHSLLGKSIKAGKFNESVLYPTHINKAKAVGKAPYVCANCDAIITTRPAPSCSNCRVTYYCNRACQVKHWKTGGHKQVCQKAPAKGGNNKAATVPRKSFVFDMEDAKPPEMDGRAFTSFNHKTGNMVVKGADKELRSKLGKDRTYNVSKMRSPKNVHGDREFIVKLQPPAGIGMPSGPWMCYDGPTRSFQAYIPGDTVGLPEVYSLLQRKGIHSSNPMTGLSGYKGYFKARWEGGSLRVFYDQVVSPELW